MGACGDFIRPSPTWCINEALWGKAMDVSHWLAWSLIIIPVTGALTIATLIVDEWKANWRMRQGRAARDSEPVA